MKNPFKWRHYLPEIIILCVSWYLRYPLSYRQLEEMMKERGLELDHTTIFRWIICYSPELEKQCRKHLKPVNCSYRIDETYIKVKKQWKYLYRAVDKEGQTIDFLLCAKRDSRAARRFFKKILSEPKNPIPRVINVDKNPAYPMAVKAMKREGLLPKRVKLRPVKYLNNIIEQDHRFIKRQVSPGLGFFSFDTAWATLRGYEAMHMIRKGRVKYVSKDDVLVKTNS